MAPDQINPPSARPAWPAWGRIALLAGIVFALKLVLHLLDPDFYFYIGDSNEYLKTAAEGYFPPGRSWLYGYLVRWIALGSGSAAPLVWVQTLATTATATLLGILAGRHFRAPDRVALAVAVFAALSPLGLLYERTLLTEAFGLLAFVLFLAAGLECLRSRGNLRLVWLGSAVLLGVACLTMRLAFMPIVILGGLTIPVLGLHPSDLSPLSSKTNPKPGSRRGLLDGVLALTLVLVVTWASHAAYRSLTGKIGKGPAAYQYQDGWYMLVATSVALKPEHGSNPEMEKLVAGVGVPLDRAHRTEQMWREDGLRYLGYLEFGEHEGNRIAKATALRVLASEPGAMAANAWKNLMVYWSESGREAARKEDLNSHFYARDPNAMSPEFVTRVRELFDANLPAITESETLTRNWFLTATPLWSRLLTLTPVLGLIVAGIAAFGNPSALRPLLWLTLLGGAYLGLVLLLTLVESFRLLYPLEPLALLILAGAASLWTSARPKHRENS